MMGRMYKVDPRRGKLVILIVFLALGGLWLGGNWPRLVARLAKVDYLARGEVRSTLDLQGILIADEQVLVAPAAGRIQWLVPDGQRVRIGQTVARITTAGGIAAAINAPAAGLLSYTTDGLETVLRSASLPDMTMPALTGLKTVTVAGGQEVGAGQDVGRVTDNLDPVYIYVDPAQVPSGMLAQGKPWLLTWQGQELPAVVSFLRGPAGGLFLRLGRYPDQMVGARQVNFAAVTRTLSGYLVPQTALVARGGQTGLYLVQDGQAHWAGVQVSGYLQGVADLAEPLPDQAALYVVNPRWVRDGVPVS